jgi:hypothetical protein
VAAHDDPLASARSICAAAHSIVRIISSSESDGSRPASKSSTIWRSALPLTQRPPRWRIRASVPTGSGPAATSPPQTIRSTPARSTSASTASSAGTLPWMS